MEAVAAKWFERWSDWIFDQIDLPRDEAGAKLRAAMRPRIAKAIRGERDGKNATMHRGRFVHEVLVATDPMERNRPDFQQLHRAWDFSMAIACGYHPWKNRIDPDILESRPAIELIAVTDGADLSYWKDSWGVAGGRLYGAERRMIAPVRSEIWVTISRFGLPWPPFDFDDGLALRSVRWREAEELGIPDNGPASPCWWDIC